MKLRERADLLANSIFSTMQTSPDADLAKAVADVIEKSIIDVVLEERQRCANVATGHGTPDADLAHKIAEDIHRARDAEIAGRASTQW